jgi:hypothetical protein
MSAILFLLSTVWLQAFAAEDCPESYKKGKDLGKGIYQLTGAETDPKTGRPLMNEIADPAPPHVTEKGEVEIFGTGDAYIRYPNWKEFERGGCFEIVKLDLKFRGRGNALKPSDPPWDLRKFIVKSGQETKGELILGGAMSPGPGRELPKWPDDNELRRVFAFRKAEGENTWVRDEKPMVGDTTSGWINHSYGGNLFQANMPAANVIRESAPTYLFYEKVSHTQDGKPHKTEIFAKQLTGKGKSEKEIPIFTIGDKPYPSNVRTIGGFLAEGPRPVQVTIQGKKFYLLGFSSGDFPTDKYSINFLWSKEPLGPYQPMLNQEGTDLKDFGKGIKEKYKLSWVGRPALYQAPNGKYEVLFHGVFKSAIPDNDYSKWPEKYQLQEFKRSIFKAPAKLGLDGEGRPVVEISGEKPGPGREENFEDTETAGSASAI